MSLRVLELFGDIKILVDSNGDIRTLKHTKVRSNGRVDNRNGRVLKQKINKYGYGEVTLSSDGKRKTYLAHRLVAAAFIPNPENKQTINHKDGNKLNNHANNLEWATQKENQQHKWQYGLANYNRDATGRFR